MNIQSKVATIIDKDACIGCGDCVRVCPKETISMASQNLLLGAHAMGLGTCVIGYAAAAMNRDPVIQAAIDMPPSETVHAVITVGWPDETYHRLAGRKPPIVRTPNTNIGDVVY